MHKQTILLTGGLGYIGSHTAVALIEAGFTPVIVDNLTNSHSDVLGRIEAITRVRPVFYHSDVRDTEVLKTILSDHEISSVIHFAALKAVAESVANPLLYFANNVGGVISLLQAMKEAGTDTIVYSSSATVYGNADVPFFCENDPVAPVNPYGQTKAMGENILNSLCATQDGFRAAILRYFNPVGAHESGLIGEDPRGVPNNLVPYLSQVAVGMREKLTIFGNDYPTPDGTCIRDYIHVVDVAQAHVRALQYLQQEAGCLTLNIGTGRGNSVLEILEAFSEILGCDIPHVFGARRVGDVTRSCANPALAKKILGWKAERNLTAMCTDALRWQKNSAQRFS